jgi:hypothetical protein
MTSPSPPSPSPYKTTPTSAIGPPIIGHRSVSHGGLTALAAHTAICGCVAGVVIVFSSNTVASYALSAMPPSPTLTPPPLPPTILSPPPPPMAALWLTAPATPTSGRVVVLKWCPSCKKALLYKNEPKCYTRKDMIYYYASFYEDEWMIHLNGEWKMYESSYECT